MEANNAAAMRDVLVDVYNTLEKLQPYALQINDISLRRGFRGRLCHAKNVIDTALAAPPRNCDVYTHDEALEVWAAENEKERNGCFDEWLYHVATKKEGKADGSK